MALLYNKKTKKNEQVLDSSVTQLLKQDNSPYLPVPTANYLVSEDTFGESKRVSGNDLYSHLNSGYNLVDETYKRAKEYVKETGSATKQFFGQVIDEGLTLGISEEIKNNMEKNPYQKMLIQAEKDVYGTSRTLGAVTGFLAPLIATGGAALLGKGAAKAGVKGVMSKVGQAVGKGAKATPVNALVQLSHGAGKVGAKALSKGGKLGKAGGYVFGSAAAEGVVYGGAKAAGEVATDYLSGDEIDIKDAFSQGVDRGAEIAKFSAIAGGAFVGVGTVGYGAYKGVKKAGQVVGDTGAFKKTKEFVRTGISKHLRTSTFNMPGTQTAKGDLIKTIKKNKKFINTLDDVEIDNFFNNLPEEVKKGYLTKEGLAPSAKRIKGHVIDDLIKKGTIEPGDVFSLYASGIKKINNGKLPATIDQVATLLQKSNEQTGSILGKLRQKVDDKLHLQGEKLNTVKDKIRSEADIPKLLAGDDIQVRIAIDRQLKQTPDSLLPKFVNDYKANKVLDEKSIESASTWLFKTLDGNLDDVLNAQNLSTTNKKLFKQKIVDPLKLKGFNQKDIPSFLEEVTSHMKANQTFYNSLTDADRLKKVLYKKNISPKDVDFLNDIKKRYGKGAVAPNNKMVSDIEEITGRFVDSPLYANKEHYQNIVREMKDSISGIEGATVSSPLLKKIKDIEKVMQTKSNITLFDIRDIKQVFDDLAKFDKSPTQLNVRAREMSSKLSALEDDIFKNMSTKKHLAEDAKKLRKLKDDYSMVSDMQGYVEKLNSSDLFQLNFRDILILGTGSVAGGIPGALTAYGLSKLIGKKTGFLKAADFLDNVGRKFKKSNSIFAKFSNENKMKVTLNKSKKSKGMGIGERIVSIANIGKIMGITSHVKNLEELALELETQSQNVDYYMNLGSENYEFAQKYGGDEGAAMYSQSMGQLVALVKEIIPQGYIDPVTRKRKFTKSDEYTFRFKMNIFANPESILEKAKFGNLSQDDLITFQSFYPKHHEDFVTNFIHAVQNNKIKLTRGILSTYNKILGLSDPAAMVGIDNAEQAKKQEQLAQARSGGIKFKSTEQNHQTLGNRIENL